MVIYTADSLFSATMYISDSDETSQNTIGDEMKEFCRVKIDLRKLPVFSSRNGTESPFYTGRNIL